MTVTYWVWTTLFTTVWVWITVEYAVTVLVGHGTSCQGLPGAAAARATKAETRKNFMLAFVGWFGRFRWTRRIEVS